MMNNQRGGILSTMFMIPAVVVLLAGVFLLGYYLGRYQGKSDVSNLELPPLPPVASQNLPKPEDFTFYKTLTAREDKTVSIDLHTASAERAAAGKQADNATHEPVPRTAKERDAPSRSGGKTAATEPARTVAVKKTPEPQRKEVPDKQTATSKQRYSVQISSHQERQTADLEVKKMKHQGFAAFIVSSALPGKGTWYRVRIGSFPSRVAAEKLQKEVRAKAGISSVVVME